MTGVLSAANEKAVEMFIDEKYVFSKCHRHTVTVTVTDTDTDKVGDCCLYRISYLDIFKVVELTCEKHQEELVTAPSLEEIIHYDLWAREYAASVKPTSTSPTPVGVV